MTEGKGDISPALKRGVLRRGLIKEVVSSGSSYSANEEGSPLFQLLDPIYSL